MKPNSILIVMSFLVFESFAPPATLEIREGIIFEKNSPVPYSGFYTKYYSHISQKECEGELRNGLPDDGWTYYYSNGFMKCEAEFENGVKIKTKRSFYEDGSPESLFDEEKQTYTTWYINGKVKSETHFLQGRKEGFSKEWYPDGQLKSEYIYYHHLEHGICKEYYEGGQLSLVSIYNNGIKSGFWKSYDFTGRLLYQGRYSDGYKVGTWVERNESGKLAKHIY